MLKYFNSDLADLAHQLTLSPRKLRLDQVDGVERLLALIDESKAYPFELVCFQITAFHKRGPDTSASIPGKALVGDLVALAECITRKANLRTSEIDRSYMTHEQVAKRLHVSTKTIRRWRSRGLMGIRLVFEDGVSRLAFLNTTVDRFVEQHKDLVARGASFRQLSEAERTAIVKRAGELVALQPLKLHAAARIIAEETGRAVETVRYTLRKNEDSTDGRPLFCPNAAHPIGEREAAMWSCHNAGESKAQIATAFDISEAEVLQTLCVVEVQMWRRLKLGGIYNELFDAPNADALILDVPEQPGREETSPRIPSDLPAYLRSLYMVPLLTFEQEQDLFRRYNYLKHKTAKAIGAIDIDAVTPEQTGPIREALQAIDALKQHITQANLRLVVSIAKKHVGWSPRFFEVISDGNISLMRAVEGFDYARGHRFSTYASWAVMKNYARSIPEEHYHTARYVTGQDELLAAKVDYRGDSAPTSDRTTVQQLLREGLAELDEREREIVSGHFGLAGGDKPQTLDQLGKRFGVTKERIRQLEQRALARLREVLSPSLADMLPA